jgi:hypothetical protein
MSDLVDQVTSRLCVNGVLVVRLCDVGELAKDRQQLVALFLGNIALRCNAVISATPGFPVLG